MPLPNLIVHVVPIQVTLTGETATITCADPRAKIVSDELHFTFDKPPPNMPNLQQRVRFIVEDPPDTTTHDNYLNMSSAPPFERLIAWNRSANVSTSPEMTAGHSFEFVAVAFGIPQQQTELGTPVQIAHGRRRFQLRDPGAGGGGGLFD